MKGSLFFLAFFLLYLLITSCSEQPTEPKKTTMWEKVSNLPGTISLVQIESNIIYAACYAAGGDIFISSSDFGKTWQSSDLGTYIQVLGFLWIKDNRSFISGTDGLYKSEDFGHTWNKDTVLTNYVGQPWMIPLLSGIAFKDNVIYLGQVMSANMNSSYIRGIFKSTDDGQNWYCPNPYGTPWGVWGLTITESNIVISNLGKVYYSPDDCETWIEAAGEFDQHDQIQKLYQIDSRIFALNGKKIFYSDNGGEYWFNCSDGLPPYNQSDNQSLDWLTFTSSENHLFILRTDGVIYFSNKDNLEWKIFNSELPAKYYWKLFVADNYLYYSSENDLWRTKISDQTQKEN